MKNSQTFSIPKTNFSNLLPKRKFTPKWIVFLLLIMIILSAVLSLSLGAVSIPLSELFAVLTGKGSAVSRQIFLYVRLPRTCGCLLAGLALATAGSILQTVLANPLAAPNVIGVNASAGFFVTFFSAIVIKQKPTLLAMTPLVAFLGALLGVSIVLTIAERTGASKITLVLAGIAISSMFNAGIDAIVTFIPDALMGYTDFRIGGFANITMNKILPAVWVILPVFFIVCSLCNELDILGLGTETAQSLGLPAKPMRLLFLALAAALSGAAVSFAGLLGFVGLLVPHIMRKLVGEESHLLLPCSALGGASFVTICDLLSRTLFRPYELPVGIVLSLAGGTFFLWLLFHQRGGRSK